MRMLFVAISIVLSTIGTIDNLPTETTEDIGTYRITEYCMACNDPQGNQSASGVALHEGHVAMNGVPLGTEIELEGERYTVVDRCGIDGTVDIFKESDSCQCKRMDYKQVKIVKKGARK